MRFLFTLICAASLLYGVLVQAQAQQAGQQERSGGLVADVDDLAYRSALYLFLRGRYEEAYIDLAVAMRQKTEGEVYHYRNMLAGQLALELKRYEVAQRYFDALTLEKVSTSLQSRLSYPLAKLNYEKADCTGVINALTKTTKLATALDYEARYMLVSCMMQYDDLDQFTFSQAEKILGSVLDNREEPTEYDIWFAYAFYNMAIAADENEFYSDAHRYYNEALKYTPDNEEGWALDDRIHLSLAYTNYAANRFEYAMRAFEVLPLNGLWADTSLLGYGWAAFKNYKKGLALEAWRQLVNLPYKSMSVYEGYIAIPYAFERANAFGEALVGYENAIVEYTKVLTEINNLSSTLTLDGIVEHALEYAQSEGGAVKPLHPLLAYTYSGQDFRVLIEQIAEIDKQKKRLESFRQQVALQEESRLERRFMSKLDSLIRQQGENKVGKELDSIKQRIDDLSGKLLAEEINKETVDPALREQYSNVVKLERLLEQTGDAAKKAEMAPRIQRLKGVLLGQLYEQNPKSFEAVTQLTADYQYLVVRFEAFKRMSGMNPPVPVTDANLNAVKKKIDQLEKRSADILFKIQVSLLEKTLYALTEQRRRIEMYKRQARVQHANLEEEFFQKGGRKF